MTRTVACGTGGPERPKLNLKQLNHLVVAAETLRLLGYEKEARRLNAICELVVRGSAEFSIAFNEAWQLPGRSRHEFAEWYAQSGRRDVNAALAEYVQRERS